MVRSRVFLFVLGCLLATLAGSGAGCSSSNGSVTCGPPIVAAGEDFEGSVGVPAILRGTVRLEPEDQAVCQSEKDSLNYEWSQFSGPDVILENADQRDASFTPTEPGEYVFHFKAIYPVTKVNPSETQSQPDSVKVTVASITCNPPVADAGEPQTLTTFPGTPVTATLDGSGSQPTSQPGCTDCQLIGHAWTVVSEPPGSSITITNSNQATATVELTEIGVYQFQLEVQDSCGTDGRSDTDADTLMVNLMEKEGCGAVLDVTVVDAATSNPIAGAEVTVVDFAGAAHTQTANASGVASFSSLAEGNRKSITVVSSETVTALPGTGDTNRPKYEVTTLVDHCSAQLSIPVFKTASGLSAGAKGIAVAKMPAALFSMLPHSWKCAGSCSTDTDCDPTYYCESAAPCAGQCTPKSVLPFFSLGDPNVSGQMRMAVLIPILPVDNFSRFEVGRLFANPPTADAVLPGNLATDDTFLNGLSATLGLDPWGNPCVSRDDCPTPEDPQPTEYVCEEDPNSEFRCKDKSPLRNIRMRLPAGENRLVLVSGIMNVSMAELLPVLLPFVTGSGEGVEFDIGAMLGAFKIRTLHVCPITVNITAGAETDIAAALQGITESNCWNVTYQQTEATVPLVDPAVIASGDTCSTDNDCCNTAEPPECGWPESQKKCLPDPDSPANKYCFTPLFRVQILSNDEIRVINNLSGFDPTPDRADTRACGFLPAQADYEVMCDNEGIIGPCDPRQIEQMSVPADAECSFPYGLSMVALDFPVGHAALPGGGRVGIGFNFNRTPYNNQLEPRFLLPSLDLPALQGATVTAAQLFVRKIKQMDDGNYQILPGVLGAMNDTDSPSSSMSLPTFLAPPSPTSLNDSGFEMMVTFVAEDPLVWPNPVITRVFSTMAKLMAPVAGTHGLPAAPAFNAPAGSELVGLVLSRVNRILTDTDAIIDPLWRVYARPGTSSIELPAAASPFSSGQEVWLKFFGANFEAPFDFDLFPADLLLTGEDVSSTDSYATLAP